MTSATDTLLLDEYQTSPPLRLGADDLRLLESLPSDRLTVLATGEPGRVALRATSWVGTIRLRHLVVRISPKVPDLRNVLMMMTASAGLTDWSTDDVDYGVDDLVEGTAELVLHAIDAATRRGLVHGYRERDERLSVIRGRLLVNELARRPWEVSPAPCRFDEFTVDVAENRVLRSCVEEVLGWELAPAVRHHARLLLARLEGVGESSYPLQELHSIRMSPVNEHYGPAMALCGSVLQGSSLLHATGHLQARAFLIDMNALYEAWIGAELSRRLWPDVQVLEQANVALSHSPTVRMRPDLLFQVADQAVAVADIKYKLTSSGIARTADYYQLLAYATVLGLDRGTLIYCQADEAPADEITVVRGGQRLRCHPLGLGGDWDAVSGRLERLAQALLLDAQSPNRSHPGAIARTV